nr:ribonuclease H-like domain, reverse transcriptase, RNA-dependent DNA polymerase [Tanacetum cinerariifolium]
MLRPTPSIDSSKSNTSDLQKSNFFVSKHGESSSSIMSKPMIKFVKAADCPGVIKTNKTETARKSPVKYAEMYRNTSKSLKVRGNQRNWNNLKSQQLGKDFLMQNKACFKCGHFDHLASDCGVWVEKGKTWPKNNFTHKNVTPRAVLLKTGRTPIAVNRTNMNVAQPKMTYFAKTAHSNVRRPFHEKLAVRTQSRVPRVSTVTKKFPTIDSKFSTAKSTFTADLGNKGKAGNSQNNIDDKGYWDSGCSWHMTGNISYLSEYEPYDGGYMSFGQGGGKINGKDSNYGGATQDRKSTTGGCQFLGRRLISWQSKKQTIVATSTTEAEYVAAASGCGQFWSTTRIETTNEETKILATIDGKPRTISESSLRRHLKLNDEERISSLPDTELFENLSLMGYNILQNQRFTFQKGQFSHHWKFLIHTIMQCLSPKSTGFNKFSSNIATAVVCLATNRVYNFSKMIFDEQHSPHHDPSSPSHPTTTTEPIPQTPNETPIETPTLRQYSRRATRITQSKALSPAADEPAYLLRDDSQGEAFPTVSCLDAGQDKENNNKTSALPHESSPMVTSFNADEGSMQQKLQELMELCTGLQSMEIQEEVRVERSTKLGSNNTEEMVNLLSSMEAANILTIEVAAVSVSPVAAATIAGVPTVSRLFPTVSAIFTTASVVTPYSRRPREISAKDKGKEKVVESEVLKKRKLQEQIDAQVAREMEKESARENQRLSKQLARDSEITKIHVEEELKMMIEGLDRSNKLVPLEEVYVEALLVKHPIIDWEIHYEGQRDYWKIIRLGDQLWTHNQAFMHDPLEWKLYDTCDVHHVFTKDQEMFMLVENDYPLRKGLATVMICNKLQVEQYSQMANDLILKIYDIANSPR